MVTEFLQFDVFPLSFKSFVFYLQCGWLIGFIGMILVEVFFYSSYLCGVNYVYYVDCFKLSFFC